MIDNIRDFPGYHISREGVVYSRWIKGKHTLGNKYNPLKAYTRSNGYKQVVLKIRSQNKIRRAYIHRLVAEAYIPNPLFKPIVGHLDNNRANNNVLNLCWYTAQENTNQAMKEDRLGCKKRPKFIVISDLHINDWGKWPSRLDSAFKILDYISDMSVDLNIPVLHCGDLFHRPESISAELFDRVQYEFNLLDQKDWTLYSISGNHCCNHINRINEKPSSWVSRFANTFKFLKCIDFDRLHIGKFYIHGVPYIDHNIGLSEYLKKINVNIGKSRSKHILMLHTDYPGASDNDGRVIDSVENLNLNILNKFDLVLCGHIHKPQRLGKKMYMIGCPYQQRRTDNGSKLGYWILYSDLSMKFKELTDYPKFIDVYDESEIKEDGNYYTVIPKLSSKSVETKHKITKQLTKKQLARRYMRQQGDKDKTRLNLLTHILTKSEKLC